MLEYSYSYETYRICLQQYLDSIWIFLGVGGAGGGGGGGGGGRPRHDRLTTDQDWPGQTHSFGN